MFGLAWNGQTVMCLYDCGIRLVGPFILLATLTGSNGLHVCPFVCLPFTISAFLPVSLCRFFLYGFLCLFACVCFCVSLCMYV